VEGTEQAASAGAVYSRRQPEKAAVVQVLQQHLLTFEQEWTDAASGRALPKFVTARKYDSSKRKVGRPQKQRDIRKLVVEMALANLGWGYTKIRDALRTGLKIEIGRTTVANILAKEGIEPALRALSSHQETLSGYSGYDGHRGQGRDGLVVCG
jgi:hypothetical protein